MREPGWPACHTWILHQDRPDGPFGVTVPDLPGCFSAVDPDGGIVATVGVDNGLLSERAVRLAIMLPRRMLAPFNKTTRRARVILQGSGNGSLAQAVVEWPTVPFVLAVSPTRRVCLTPIFWQGGSHDA